MKIAQVAPIWTRVPPKGYGGAEKIISLVTDELVNRGHEVTLFASGDSETKAKLHSVVKKSPGLSKEAELSIVNNMNHLFNMFTALEESEQFDLIHWHVSKDIAPIMFVSKTKTPSLITIHNHFYLDEEMPFLKPIFEHYKDFSNFVSISNFHRKFFPFNYLATVYNGIDLAEFEFNESPEEYMAWIGRFEFQKGAHLAIQAAIKLKKKLKLAAPKDENEYFNTEIKPYLDNDLIKYVGEIGPVEKNKILKNAKVFLNPIQWDEPFGLVVPEANACGTPVIAPNKGAMSELINSGENGFVVNNNDLDSIVQATENIYRMSGDEYAHLRKLSRKRVEDNFTYQKMTENYENVYKKVAGKRFLW